MPEKKKRRPTAAELVEEKYSKPLPEDVEMRKKDIEDLIKARAVHAEMTKESKASAVREKRKKIKAGVKKLRERFKRKHGRTFEEDAARR